MSTTHAALALDRFDLLPPSFRYQNRVWQLICSWLTIVCSLVVTLGAVTVATVLREHRVHRMNEQIASTAIPLMDLRRDVIRLEEENDQRNQLCRWVDATRPDENALQTLAAVALASQSGTHENIIDSLQIRLPVEFPISVTETPPWAVPNISISARIVSAGAAQRWVDRLNNLDRIEAASIVVDSDESEADDDRPTGELLEMNGEMSRVQLTATPLATRVLP